MINSVELPINHLLCAPPPHSSPLPHTYPKDDALRRQFFNYLTIGMTAGALVWCVITLSFGYFKVASVPGGYLLATAANFLVCNRTKNTACLFNFQTFISIILPFAFQVLLGGYYESGFVMLWSMVSVIGAMTYQSRVIAFVWFGFYLVCVVITVIINPWAQQFANETFLEVSTILTLVNIIMVSTILFGLSRYFISMQITMRQKMKDRSLTIAAASEEIALQNQEIKESIRYAKYLQVNILPSKTKLDEVFSNHFILFKPKDVVSGDFYWYGEKQGIKIMAVIDCTGHGVPGAFMSMMAYNLLNEIILSKGLTQPDAILEKLNKAVIRALKQNFTGKHDGMDLAIVCIDEANKKISYAGARSHLSIVFPSGEMKSIRGTRRSIGGVSESNLKPFTKSEFELKKGTTLYFATDGFADQFGGPNNKKYGTKNLIKWFGEQHNIALSHQLYSLENELDLWKKDQSQIDDILVAAFCI